MTVKDALDRAKRLRQARLSEQKSPYEGPPGVLGTSGQSEPRPAMQEVVRRQPAHFEPLRTVEISASACEQNRVLLSDEQLRAVPQADAAYRLLRGRVQQRLKRNNWFSLAVASPGQNDGKTLTALNLALSIAREKQRPVYVLDLDMRNPSVCAYLGIQDVRPLPDYFVGDAAPGDVLVQTSVPYLVVAGALRPVDGASEMLAGARFEELLSYIRLRSPDAVVILDLPPVNVTDEALVVAPRVDATIVVVSEGKTERNALARTLSVLSEYSVAGVIVNRATDVHAAKYDSYPT